MSDSDSSRHVWLLVLLLLVAAGVRLYALDHEPLWLDEAVSVHYAKRALFDIPAGDPHPHLYYALLHFWLALGDQEGVVRGLSVVFGLFTVALTWALGKALGGARLAGLAAALAAISPFLVRYSQETRMYALLGALAAGALWGLARAADQPKSTTGWTAYVLCTALMLHTHAISVVFFGLANLFLALVLLPRRDVWTIRYWALSQLAVIALWAPAIPRLLRPATRAHLSIPALDGSHFWAAAGEIYTPGLGTLSTVVAVLLALTLAIAGLRGRWHDPLARWMIIVFALLPLPLTALISLARPVLLARVLIWATAPWLLLLAAGVLRLRGRLLRATAFTLLAVFSLLGLQNYFHHQPKEAWDRVAAHVGKRVQPDDLVVFVAGYVEVPFDYYFRRQEIALDRHPMASGTVEPDNLRALERAVLGRDRIWLVRSHSDGVDPTDSVLATLRRSHVEDVRAVFTGVEVHLMRSASR